ncbi:hypothetical protein NPIL_421351 [Nephila pilipes]|uniref:Uncharacterized protein n=1 Tax=Nephila pilipes TaxID=299642 RepID=A0A8X6MNZ6_NEPPI|nr:hypothetical protein NPIL_421351 [Nephila pilipes]
MTNTFTTNLKCACAHNSYNSRCRPNQSLASLCLSPVLALVMAYIGISPIDSPIPCGIPSSVSHADLSVRPESLPSCVSPLIRTITVLSFASSSSECAIFLNFISPHI